MFNFQLVESSLQHTLQGEISFQNASPGTRTSCRRRWYRSCSRGDGTHWTSSLVCADCINRLGKISWCKCCVYIQEYQIRGLKYKMPRKVTIKSIRKRRNHSKLSLQKLLHQDRRRSSLQNYCPQMMMRVMIGKAKF